MKKGDDYFTFQIGHMKICFNMTLDEAIEHCKEKVNDSPCGQNHLQLMNWLIELKHLKGEI